MSDTEFGREVHAVACRIPEVVLLTHRLPRYTHAPEGMRATYPGEYVHEMHAQAIAERVILADTALRQGRVGQAHELIREAVDYLRRGNHTR